MFMAPADPTNVTVACSGVTRRTRALLFFGFAFAVMADPVSSVAYAIEAALRALHGHLGLLLPTMGIVIGIIGLVTLNYWQLVRAFPEGGGSPEAAGRAFGEEWSFLPIGALVVDFALTIAISIAAAGSAIIAYVPAVAPARIPIALGLTVLVAGLTWFGHGGRLIFATMTWLFIIAAAAVLLVGWISPRAAPGQAPISGSASPALVAVILAFPVAMALATGTEAPATSIAQLGQLDSGGKAWFGRGTLLLTIGIVGTLTMGLTALAVHLHVGVPKADSTQIADLAHTAAGNWWALRVLPAGEQRAVAGGGKLIVSGGPGFAQSPGPERSGRRARLVTSAVCPDESSPHAGRCRRCLCVDRGGHHRCCERPGAGARAGVRGGCVRQFPRRSPGDGALFSPGRLYSSRCHECGGRCRRRVYAGRQPGSRLPVDRDRRHRDRRRLSSLEVGAGGASPRH